MRSTPSPQKQSDSPFNNWLHEHPVALGFGLIAIGALFVFLGIRELRSGVSRDKYGIEYKGGMARTMAMVRVAAGAAFAGFGIYKVIAG